MRATSRCTPVCTKAKTHLVRAPPVLALHTRPTLAEEQDTTLGHSSNADWVNSRSKPLVSSLRMQKKCTVQPPQLVWYLLVRLLAGDAALQLAPSWWLQARQVSPSYMVQ